MKNLENYVNKDISTFLNFAKKKNSIFFGIKSILRNKTKIKLIIKIKEDDNNQSLFKDLEHLKNNYNIKILEIERENLINSTFLIQDNLKTIGITDNDLSVAIIKKISSI